MSSKPQPKFSPQSFGLRMAFATTLVLLTYNPSGYSFFHWIKAGDLGPEHLLGAVLLVIGWAMFIRATLRSLGKVGVILGAVFFGALIWVLVDFGLMDADSFVAIKWISLICLSGLLAVGMSWSHIRRRMAGQYDVDDVDD